MGEIKINHVIIHIMDSTVGMPVLSDQEMECTAELKEFLETHILKIAAGDDTKDCLFVGESEVREWMEIIAPENFVEISHRLGERLYRIMNGNPDIPSADVAMVQYDEGERPYLAILKMNYKTSYTHITQPGEMGNVNDLIPHKTILPSSGQKLTEAALINLDTLDICLLEKKYEVNGQRENYFSERFLQCRGALSRKARLAIVTKEVEKVQKEFCNESEQFTEAMKAKSILHSELEEKGELDIPFVADRIFPDSLPMREQFMEKMEKYNITREPIAPQSARTVQKFEKQYITTESGIEIRIPMEQYNQPGCVEFITHEDGSISVMLNHVGKLVSK